MPHRQGTGEILVTDDIVRAVTNSVRRRVPAWDYSVEILGQDRSSLDAECPRNDTAQHWDVCNIVIQLTEDSHRHNYRHALWVATRATSCAMTLSRDTVGIAAACLAVILLVPWVVEGGARQPYAPRGVSDRERECLGWPGIAGRCSGMARRLFKQAKNGSLATLGMWGVNHVRVHMRDRD